MEIKINLTTDGKVMVSGNINETVVCLGLLEIAKDIVKNHAQQMVQEQTNKIIRPEFIPPKEISGRG